GNVHRVFFFVDDDRLHFGRRHRVDDELGRIVVPQHDVDTLAIQLVRYRLHARTAHADARADRIGTAVVRHDRDLRAVAGVAGGALDLDQALADFRHFDPEQFDHEFRRSARHEQLRTALLGAHLVQITAHAIASAHRFARDCAIARNIGFGIAAEIQVHAATLDTLDDAGYEFADAILVSL